MDQRHYDGWITVLLPLGEKVGPEASDERALSTSKR